MATSSSVRARVSVCPLIIGVLCFAGVALGRGPLPPAPPLPPWWGINTGTNEQVCYNFDDGLLPPTPSQQIVAAGTNSQIFTADPLADIGGVSPIRYLRVPEDLASTNSIQTFDVTNPPDYKEVYISVDLYSFSDMAAIANLTWFLPATPIPAPGTGVQIISSGVSNITPPAPYDQGVHFAALIQVWPCPSTYSFSIFQPNGGFAIDNMCIGGQCFPGTCPPQPYAPITWVIPAPGGVVLGVSAAAVASRRRRIA